MHKLWKIVTLVATFFLPLTSQDHCAPPLSLSLTQSHHSTWVWLFLCHIVYQCVKIALYPFFFITITLLIIIPSRWESCIPILKQFLVSLCNFLGNCLKNFFVTVLLSSNFNFFHCLIFGLFYNVLQNIIKASMYTSSKFQIEANSKRI